MRLELETDRFYLGRDYSEALFGSGAIPFHLSLIPEREYISEALKYLDGILLPGSDTDVDPLRFGSEPHPKLGKSIKEKDETDLMVLDEAEKLNLPVLAICFGMQILNVWRGGTLIQDIDSQIENCIKHEQGKPLARNSHTVIVEEGSLIADLTGSNTAVVNSHHHQAVENVGRNLIVTSRTRDGVVESLEGYNSEQSIIGVQWHPELSWKSDSLSKNLFRKFVDICASKTFNVKG